MSDLVTVTRTMCTGSGLTISETATAALPDDLTLDHLTEAARRYELAQLLFQSLPQLQPKSLPSPPCPPPPYKSSRN